MAAVSQQADIPRFDYLQPETNKKDKEIYDQFLCVIDIINACKTDKIPEWNDILADKNIRASLPERISDYEAKIDDSGKIKLVEVTNEKSKQLIPRDVANNAIRNLGENLIKISKK